MNSAIPALLALILVCSLPAVVVVAASPTDERTASVAFEETEETTNRLTLDDGTRSDYTTSEPNIGLTLAKTDSEHRIDYDLFTVDQNFDSASADERQALIEAVYDRVHERMDELKSKERDAARLHANDQMSDGEFIQTLLMNHHEATELVSVLDDLNERAHTVPGYSIRDLVREDTYKLETHSSPIRSQLAASEVSDEIVLVESTETGYSLATIADSEYVRETHRFDNRDEDASDQFDGISEASDYAEELYPYAYEHGSGSNFAALFSHGLYRVQIPHDQGTLDAYFDGGTQSVTYEVQELSLSELPEPSAGESWVDDDLELVINETSANGPVVANVTSETTGEPVDAVISVNGTEVGETDSDGTLWLIPPSGDYEVSAETTDGSVIATISRS